MVQKDASSTLPRASQDEPRQKYQIRYPVWPHTVVEIDNEMFFTIMFPLPLIKWQWQLTVAGESMGNKYWLSAYAV